MEKLIKQLRHKKWQMQSDLRNCIYYFVKRKSNTIPTVNDSNVRVCFILQRTEIFTSVQSIFEAMCADARFSVSILVLPRYDHAKRSSIKEKAACSDACQRPAAIIKRKKRGRIKCPDKYGNRETCFIRFRR